MNRSIFRLVEWYRGSISPERVGALWLDKRCVLVAWLGILLAIISAPDGLGVPLCWFHSATHIPCLGCGLTRSLSCALRGLFERSWHYHPMGVPILTLFVATAMQSLLPQAGRSRIKRMLETRATAVVNFYLVFVAAFVVFGVCRALLFLARL